MHRGERVTIQIETVLPFGVFCRTAQDGSRGYIRRRELTLQGTLDPRNVVQPGDILEVLVLELAADGKIIEFSRRRALPDPWITFSQKTRVWDTVDGTVKAVRNDRVVVEVQPGVDGIISLEDLSTNQIQNPEELVWPGDRVRAVVVGLNLGSRKLHLSSRHYLERDSLISRVMDQMTDQERHPHTQPREPEGTLLDGRLPLNYPGQILVAEDDPDVRTALMKWLESEGCQADMCSNGAEALSCFEARGYSLLFTDINMPVVDGITLAQKIRTKTPDLVCVFLSDPDTISQNLDEIETLDGYIVTKPIDTEDLYLFLEGLSAGRLPLRTFPLPAPESSPFHYFEEKISSMRSEAPLSERIEIALAHLLSETGAEKVILFNYDPISRLISIASQVGPVWVNESQVNYLVSSPVEDVITEDRVIWDNNLSNSPVERYENLLKLLPFQACIGMPVRTGDERNHALFIFHRQPDTFSRYRVRDVQAAASLISVALEEDLFRQHVRNSSALILNGQLSSAFNHEIYNKITVLDLQVDMLTTAYRALLDHLPQSYAVEQAGLVSKSLGEVAQAVSAIKRMSEDFRQIMRGGATQPISINQILQQAFEQVKPAAARENIALTQELDGELPDLRLNRFALIYVVYNLLINAVQQLENRPGHHQVKAQTGKSRANNQTIYFIRVEDNGPGIHFQLWEKVFELGFTSRPGGSGLGLYIARSLVETLGGNIYVEESRICTGTIFRIDLPEEVISQ